MIRVAMTSELSEQRNDAITYFTCSMISQHWELSLPSLAALQSRSGDEDISLYTPVPPLYPQPQICQFPERR